MVYTRFRVQRTVWSEVNWSLLCWISETSGMCSRSGDNFVDFLGRDEGEPPDSTRGGGWSGGEEEGEEEREEEGEGEGEE